MQHADYRNHKTKITGITTQYIG